MSDDELEPYRNHPYFARACQEVDNIIPPPPLRPVKREDVRTLMVLAWLRGASWQAHDTN
jgi:hypothetical protein